MRLPPGMIWVGIRWLRWYIRVGMVDAWCFNMIWHIYGMWPAIWWSCGLVWCGLVTNVLEWWGFGEIRFGLMTWCGIKQIGFMTGWYGNGMIWNWNGRMKWDHMMPWYAIQYLRWMGGNYTKWVGICMTAWFGMMVWTDMMWLASFDMHWFGMTSPNMASHLVGPQPFCMCLPRCTVPSASLVKLGQRSWSSSRGSLVSLNHRGWSSKPWMALWELTLKLWVLQVGVWGCGLVGRMPKIDLEIERWQSDEIGEQ